MNYLDIQRKIADYLRRNNLAEVIEAGGSDGPLPKRCLQVVVQNIKELTPGANFFTAEVMINALTEGMEDKKGTAMLQLTEQTITALQDADPAEWGVDGRGSITADTPGIVDGLFIQAIKFTVGF